MTFDEERDWFVTTARVFGHDLVDVRPHTTGGRWKGESWSGNCRICFRPYVAVARREVGFNVCGTPYLSAVSLRQRKDKA